MRTFLLYLFKSTLVLGVKVLFLNSIIFLFYWQFGNKVGEDQFRGKALPTYVCLPKGSHHFRSFLIVEPMLVNHNYIRTLTRQLKGDVITSLTTFLQSTLILMTLIILMLRKFKCFYIPWSLLKSIIFLHRKSRHFRESRRGGVGVSAYQKDMDQDCLND